MTGATAALIIQKRLGNRTGLESIILSEMSLVQVTDLERGAALPWFLLGTAPVATVANAATSAVPTSFLREYMEGGIFGEDAEGLPYRLVKEDYSVLKAQDWDSPGKPTHYALIGGLLYWFPTPGIIYNFTLLGYYKAAAVGEDTENAWLANAPDVLIARAGRNVARYLRDGEAVSLFEADIKDATLRMTTENTAREEAAFAAIMGG